MSFKLQLHPFDLELTEPFIIARGAITSKRVLIVSLEKDGVRGYGEASEHIYYKAIVPEMMDKIKAHQEMIEAFEGTTTAFSAFLQKIFPNDPFIQYALDVAYHDWHGKKAKVQLHQLWGLEWNNLPISNYTFGIDSLEEIAQKAKTLPYPILKLKLGTDYDLDLVKTVRQHTDARLRVDANASWTVDHTIYMSHELKQLGVEFIEQPLAADDWNGMKEVFAKSALPVIADESCCVEMDIERCVNHFHGINIKLMKCGGLTPALRMIQNARMHDLSIMVGCMNETTIGISTIAQLLPLVDYIDMDGATLLKNDPAQGITMNENGHANISVFHGNGAILTLKSE